MQTFIGTIFQKQFILICFLSASFLIGLENKSSAQVNHLVISQVYGGGGNGTATYKSDFVELFNPTGLAVSLTNYTVQYQAPASNNWTSAGTLTGTISAGHYYLIQLATAANGNALPAPDFANTSIDLNATSGKIVLVNALVIVTGCTDNSIIDKVGYGSTDVACNETINAPSISKTVSISRVNNGYTDNDNNSTDFSTGTPNARNSSMAAGATVTTGAATLITSGGATLNGSINANGNTTTASLFIYGITTSYGSLVNTSPASVSGYTATAVTAAVSGLTANKLYHFLLSATNSITTTNGNDVTFITLPNAPEISTASSITTTGFTASWAAPASGGDANFTYTVEVSASNNFSSVTTSVPSIASASFSTAITGLASATTYYYRVKAVNATGSSAYSATSSAVTTNTRVAAVLSVTKQPVGPGVNGGVLVTQPQVTVKDQDGAVLAGVLVNAVVTNGQSGSWALGGTTAATTNSSGIAIFSTLTSTNNTASAFAATITFAPSAGSVNTTSGNFTIPPPPANNECSGAVVLTVNNNATCTTASSGTTVGATQSFAATTGTADDDVWYSFTALSSTHTIAVSTVATGGISNPYFQCFAGSCTSLIDSGYTTTGNRNFKGLTIGTTYYVRIYSNASGSGQGAFTVCVTTPVSNVAVSVTSQVPAGAVNVNSTANIISRFLLFPSNVANTLTNVAVSFTGSYANTDINSLKLWYNTSSSLTGATQFGSTLISTSTGSGELKTFSGSASLINPSTYYYFFVTADVTAAAIPGRTISMNAITPGDFIFANANTSVSGSAAAAGYQTITTSPPVLTAASTATVDNPFAITFTENANFRNNITAISFDGNLLPAVAYNTSVAGQISFDPSQSVYLQTSKTAGISITSTGYTTATINQILKPGVATHLVVLTQPAAPANNGYALTVQPFIKVADKYENAANSTVLITAAASQATWMLGGTKNISAVSGIATYTNLTAASAAALTGAVIIFSSPGFGSVTSSAFAIPGISPLAGEVVINQINPQYANASDEYIELVNTTDKTFDLNTLTIKYASTAGVSGVDRPLSGTLLPHSFWLLSSNTMVNIGATTGIAGDGIFTAGLAATGGQLSLQWRSNGTLIDGVGYGNITSGTYYEGSPVLGVSNMSGLKRIIDGADNNNNSTDFTTISSTNIYLRNSNSRLANTGASIAAGIYSDLFVTGASLISGNVTVTNRISSLSAGQLAIGANTLTLNGVINGNVTLAVSTTSNLITGTSGTLNFATNGNTIHNLTVNGGTLTLGSPLNITAGTNYGIVKIADGAYLTTNNRLTLKVITMEPQLLMLIQAGQTILPVLLP